MKLRVEVTQEDIERGTPADPDCCPVALAMQRVLGPHAYAGLSSLGIAVEDHRYRPVMDAPDEVRRFVARFDCDKHVAPFAFDLDWPDDLVAAPPSEQSQ